MAASGLGSCADPRNPLGPSAILRAMLIALDEWATNGKRPPESDVPRVANGTAVPSLSQADQGFPNIPGVLYDGLMARVTCSISVRSWTTAS